jgi:hypothetical protein
LADRKAFSISHGNKSWEFLLTAPPLLRGVAQLQGGEDLTDETEFPSTKRGSTLFWTWNILPVIGRRAATVAWIVRCDRCHDQIPLLIRERPIEKSTFHMSRDISPTVTNNTNDHFVSQSNDTVLMISRAISPSVTNNNRASNSFFHSNNNSPSDQRHFSSHTVTFGGDSFLSMRCGVASDTSTNFDIYGVSGSRKYFLTGSTLIYSYHTHETRGLTAMGISISDMSELFYFRSRTLSRAQK